MKRLFLPAGAAGAVGAAVMILGIAACSEMRPNLLEVYPGAARIDHRPVIIIPGAFGSRLRNSITGQVVWGRIANLLTSRFKLALNPAMSQHSDLLDLPIDSTDITANKDDLEPYAIFDAVAGRAFYKRIVLTLTQVAGYTFGDIARPQPGEDCFAFYYDWRRDVAENAQLLGKAIERVRAVHQQSGGERQKVDLITHSLGGLVARYYVKYGSSDLPKTGAPEPTYAGASDVDTLVLIGVPNEGSMDTLESIHYGAHIVRPLPPEAIFTMPAAYQGLPRPRVGPFIDPNGQPLAIDLYDPANWEKYGWSAFGPARLKKLREEIVGEFGEAQAEERYQARIAKMRVYLKAALERASGIGAALERPGGRPDAVRYFAFGGDCMPTPARAMIIPREDGGYDTITRLKNLPRKLDTPEIERLMSEPGDGSVTRASLLAANSGGAATGSDSGIRLDYSLFLCNKHRDLTENITFQDNLLQFLLYRH
jgi:hypothetical protein